MDLSSLLSKAQIAYNSQSHSVISKKSNNQQNYANKSSRQELFISIFEENIDLLSSFFTLKQNHSLRLVCRGIGYMFIIRDLWIGMKHEVADKKLQDVDDYEFIQQIQPKQISKQDKKIRIHSLKKKIYLDVSLGKNIKQPSKLRQASNIKQKKQAIALIDQQLNPFRKTEIGFKRLLKANNSSLMSTQTKGFGDTNKSFLNTQQSLSIERLPTLLQIPSQYTISDLLINPKDQWVKNIHRANNLITVVKKWSSFHTRFWTYIKQINQQQLTVFMKKIIKIDGCLLNYKTVLTQQQPHTTIVQLLKGSQKNLLIEQQLNKLGKQFIQAHIQFMQIIQTKQIQQMIKQLHLIYQRFHQKSLKNDALQTGLWAEGLTFIEQSFDGLINKITNDKLKNALSKSIINITKNLILQHLSRSISFNENTVANLRQVTIGSIIEHSEFFQFIFQILYSLYGKMASEEDRPEKINNFSKLGKLGSTRFQKLELSKLKSVQSNIREQKSLFGILWNISKYFDKLSKQMLAKQKKKKQQSKVSLIRGFLVAQSNLPLDPISLITPLTSPIQQYYKTFKNKIETLKSQINHTQ